jgi:hypothetical protein
VSGVNLIISKLKDLSIVCDREYHNYSPISVMKSPNKETVVNKRFKALTAIIGLGHVDWQIIWSKN